MDIEAWRVAQGSEVDLAATDTRDKAGFADKDEGRTALKVELKRLEALQYALFAEGRQSLLIVLQAPDAGGKDGAIRRVFTAFNPQGCRVTSFKAPSSRELSHDFLWRVHQVAPRAGEVAIFNRSHYEDVLVVRVRELVPEAVWRPRYDHINAFERLLGDSGTTIVKFYLHISQSEQLDRFADRLEEPDKRWKISEADYSERTLWADYRRAFEEALARTSTIAAPWYVVPADRKWVRNVLVARIVRETMEKMAIRAPEPTVDLEDIRAKFRAARAELG